MKQNKNESTKDEVTKDTQPNSNENINQPNTNENSFEQTEKIKISLINFLEVEENDLSNMDCNDNNDGGIYSLSDKIENIKKNEGEINSKQKICKDENEVCNNFLGNKRRNVNFIESKKNKCCKYSNSSNYSNSNSNYIPLNENENNENSNYNNNDSNFLLFENQSSKNNHYDIKFSLQSLEQININQNSELITSKETRILQQNNIYQNLQQSEIYPNYLYINNNINNNENFDDENFNLFQNLNLGYLLEQNLDSSPGRTKEISFEEGTEITKSIINNEIKDINYNINLFKNDARMIDNIDIFK